MIMTKYILALIVALMAVISMAHQPEISTTMLSEQADGTWILQLSTSMTAFEHEVHTKFGTESYKTAEEFKDLVLRHVIANFAIEIDGAKKVTLENGFVRLGHETSAVFQVRGLPELISKMSIRNSSFNNIHDSQSALIILKNGFAKKQFVLNDKNHHTVRLTVSNKSFVSEV